MQHSTLLDEDFPSRVEAIFADGGSARRAATALCLRHGLQPSQISFATLEQDSAATHRNRFAFNASGRTLQKRQLMRTLVAFVLIAAGIVLMHLLYSNGVISRELAGALLAIPIGAALVITVMGMLSWRPAGAGARTRLRHNDEVVLVIKLHDVSEQYELRRALKELGAESVPGNIAEIA
ncbi:hypothetical protein E2F43_07405 [Seongchinamella unica]|uniref:Uncharacterized protein n=1 Tax=Seongchinamella unica TaxID=2547392 RepID=A0A4R5LR95_9GAMM|nr:hypothetical protein [Seongchinamella unica]TDG13362.1 hypothetical protein E2F43_07405 [Seongchinamella unica]